MADDHSGRRLGPAPDDPSSAHVAEMSEEEILHWICDALALGDASLAQVAEMGMDELLQMSDVTSTSDRGLPQPTLSTWIRGSASGRTVPYSADSGYGTASRSSGPSEAGSKGKQVLKSSFEVPAQAQVEDFARVLRDAVDIRSPYPTQLALRLPNLLDAFAHRLLSIRSREGIRTERELARFVKRNRQLVYVKTPGWASQA